MTKYAVKCKKSVSGEINMASMTVEFFKVVLKNSANDQEEDYRVIRNIFDEIKNGCIIHKNYRSIDISPEIEPNSVETKEIMDFFEDKNYLFGRACRKKLNNAMLKRDYSTLQAEEVFTDAESKKQGIEVFTFFLYDYDKGIVSIVNAKGAPGTKALKKVIETYKPEYKLEFINIPNKEGIKVLYNSDVPEISKLDFEIPTPNAEYLQKILGLNEEVILEMIQNDVFETSISLKPTPHGKLLRKKENVRNILDVLFGKKKNFSKTVIRGKSEKFNTRNFDLNAEMFTYPIDIKTYKTEKGVKINYSLQDVIEQFRTGLHTAYEENYEIIIGIADR